MKTQALGIFVAGLLIVTAPAYGAQKDKGPLNPAKNADTTSKPTPSPKPSGTPKKAESTKTQQTESTKAKQIDLRPTMKQINWKDGRNTVYSGGGVKLMADVKGGKVTRWTATDDKGKSLPTKAEQKSGPGGIVLCEVCVAVVINGKSTVQCYEIDCGKL